MIRRRGSPLRGDDQTVILTALFLTLPSSPSLSPFSSPRLPARPSSDTTRAVFAGNPRCNPPAPPASAVTSYPLSPIAYPTPALHHHVTCLPRSNLHRCVGSSGRTTRRVSLRVCIASKQPLRDVRKEHCKSVKSIWRLLYTTRNHSARVQATFLIPSTIPKV